MPANPFLPPDELRTAILDGAEALAEAGGPKAIGMRAVAAAVGCAPGTIYNALGPLDAVLLAVNARTLERLAAALEAAVAAVPPAGRLQAAADAYLDFVGAHRGAWALVVEAPLAEGGPRPERMTAALARAVALVEDALRPHEPDQVIRRALVSTLWASMQGIASLHAARRLAVLGEDDPHAMAKLLIGRFTAGRPDPC